MPFGSDEQQQGDKFLKSTVLVADNFEQRQLAENGTLTQCGADLVGCRIDHLQFATFDHVQFLTIAFTNFKR